MANCGTLRRGYINIPDTITDEEEIKRYIIQHWDKIEFKKHEKENESKDIEADNVFQKRLAKINARAAADKEKKKQEKEKAQQEWQNAFESIKKLKQRIANLLNLANACNSAGIKVYEKLYSKAGWDENFFKATENHYRLGFDQHLNSACKNNVENLMIINDSRFRETNFRVGKDGIAQGYYKRTYKEVRPRIEDMQKFLIEFDHFEEKFLNFVDNLQG